MNTHPIEPLPQEVELDLAYSAAHVTSILKPVAITMALVVWLVRTLGRSSQITGTQSYGPLMVVEEKATDDSTSQMTAGVINAVVFVVFIMTFTALFVVLYKYRCMKIIYGWLSFSVFSLLAGSGSLMFISLLTHYEIVVDSVTFGVFIFNFAVGGTIVIFYHAPMIVRQTYLVIASMIMAWILTKLPTWTNWCLLAALALYDIMAVLSPCGPLKALVEMSQERDEPIPGLVYEASAPSRSGVQQRAKPVPLSSTPASSSAAANASNDGTYCDMGRDEANDAEPQPEEEENESIHLLSHSSPPSSSSAPPAVTSPPSHPPPPSSSASKEIEMTQLDMGRGARQEEDLEGGGVRGEQATTGGEEMDVLEEEDEEDRNVKLGLGDFVFYSVLVGRAADNDIATTVTCFVAILTGLCGTLFLLAIFRRALPALPLSIFFGMAFYFLTSSLIVPWANSYAELQLFI